MPKYTTGEMAKLCGVTVRTVQYYDNRGILIPSELSEGGRRLYSDNDLKKMKIICFLRDMGVPIDSIGQLFTEEKPEDVISILIEQQEQVLNDEMSECQQKLDKLSGLKKELKGVESFTVESIGDIALIMENKKKLRKVHTVILAAGIPITVLEVASILIWIITGIWWPFLVYLFIMIPFGIIISKYYFKRVAYICPQCHEVFRPVFKEAFFAKHTPTMRKVTCTGCNHHGFCVETYGGDL